MTGWPRSVIPTVARRISSSVTMLRYMRAPTGSTLSMPNMPMPRLPLLWLAAEHGAVAVDHEGAFMRRVQVVGKRGTARMYHSGTAVGLSSVCRANIGTGVGADHAAVIGNVVDHFGARGVEAGTAARDLVVVEQLVLLGIVGIGDRRQQVGEVHCQAAAGDRTHHQRASTFVGAQLDVTRRAGCLRARSSVEGVRTRIHAWNPGRIPVLENDIAFQRVGDPVRDSARRDG